MLQRTFLHIKGVGEKRERALWKRGITCWRLALDADLSRLGRLGADVKREAEHSIERLIERDCAFFTGRLRASERWRVWPDFRDDCCCLDIETDPFHPTIVGIYYRSRYRFFMRGRDLDELPAFLKGVKFIVTYCGGGFDLPVLRRFFGEALLEKAAHLDLMHVLHGMGIKGGLKSSEHQLGITRPEDVDGLAGDDAVRLWNEYRRGDESALEQLITYNREDVINLERILDIIVPELTRERLGKNVDCTTVVKTPQANIGL